MFKWREVKKKNKLKTKADYILLLLKQGYTQKEAAHLIGCSRVTLNRQINGHIDREWIKNSLLNL